MELKDDFYIPTNEFQTEITKEFMETMPEETQEQFLDFITNVEFIRNLISPSRKRAKDLPRENHSRYCQSTHNRGYGLFQACCSSL